jgi:hypothetical protein
MHAYHEDKNRYCVSFQNAQAILLAEDSDMAVINAQEECGKDRGELVSVLILSDTGPHADVELRVGPDGKPVATPELPADFVSMRVTGGDLWNVVYNYRNKKRMERQKAEAEAAAYAHRRRHVQWTKDGLPSRNQRGLKLTFWYCGIEKKWHGDVDRLGAGASLWCADGEGVLHHDDYEVQLSDKDMMVIEAWVEHFDDYVKIMEKKTGQIEKRED